MFLSTGGRRRAQTDKIYTFIDLIVTLLVFLKHLIFSGILKQIRQFVCQLYSSTTDTTPLIPVKLSKA